MTNSQPAKNNLPPQLAEQAEKLIQLLHQRGGAQRVMLALNLDEPLVYAKTRAGQCAVMTQPERIDDQFHIPIKRLLAAFENGQVWQGKVEQRKHNIWQSDVEQTCFQCIYPVTNQSTKKIICVLYIETEAEITAHNWLHQSAYQNQLLAFVGDVKRHAIEQKQESKKPEIMPEAPQPKAIENNKEESLRLVVALHRLSIELTRIHDETAIIKAAVQGAIENLDIDRLAVFLVDDDMMQGTWGTDEQGYVQDTSYFRSTIPDHPMVHKALSKKDYVVVNENAPLYNDIEVIGTGWNAMASLWDEDVPIGWIACDNLLTGKPLQEFQRQLLMLFGSTLAQAIVRARSEKKLIDLNRNLERKVRERTEDLEKANEILKQISNLDGLTNISNRRYFDESLAREWPRCRRNSLPISLIMVDVDFFKLYNDSLGHMQGDTALLTVARCLSRAGQRASDLVARYGGEEFIIMLPETDLNDALLVAERARQLVIRAALPHPASGVAEIVTVSIGVATAFPDEFVKAEHLILAADKALYQAKEGGRNQTFGKQVLAGPQP